MRRQAETSFGRADVIGKLADYLGYYLQLTLRLARDESTALVVALSTRPSPRLLPKWTAALRGARHAHWVMDVYPDAMCAHGMLDGAAYLALQQLASHAVAGASLVLTLSPGMATTCQSYRNGSTRVEWVPLWTPAELSP